MEAQKKPFIDVPLGLKSVAVAATVVVCFSLASCHRKTAPLPRAAISWSDYGRIAAAEAVGGNAAGALLARIRHAANGGNTDAEYDLGFLYKDGPGLPKDYTKATKWYRKAALQGNTLGDAAGRMEEVTRQKRWRRAEDAAWALWCGQKNGNQLRPSRRGHPLQDWVRKWLGTHLFTPMGILTLSQ